MVFGHFERVVFVQLAAESELPESTQ